MNKRDLAILEKAFTRELLGALNGLPGVYQSKSKAAARLANDGYLTRVELTFGGTPFPVTVSGYRLTHRGRHEYCRSCTEESK